MIPPDVPQKLDFVDPSRPSLSVTTRGGEPGFTIEWRARISSDGFTDAVRTAVAAEGAFLPVVDRPGDYQLDIIIERLDHLYENRAGGWSFWKDGNPYGARSWRECHCEEQGLPIWRIWYRRR